MQNVVEIPPCEECVCGGGGGGGGGGATLGVLLDVQRAYEERLRLLARVGGADGLQKQACVLRSWVSDLVAQNALLVRAVEELERESAARAAALRRRHAEIEMELRAEACVLRRRVARKDSDLRGLVEVLRRLREFDSCTLEGIHFFEVTHSDIFGSDDWLPRRKSDGGGDSGSADESPRARTRAARQCCCGGEGRETKILEISLRNESLQDDVAAKDREIKKLKKELQQHEQTILAMTDACPKRNPDVPMKDAEVMAGMCCTGAECGDLVPVKDIDQLLRDEAGKYRERITSMELSLQSSGVKLRALHKMNLGLVEELDSLRRLLVAVDVERRDARVKYDLQRTIVKQMLRQLRQAKAQLKKKEQDYSIRSELVSGDNLCPPTPRSRASLPAPSERQPRRRRAVPPPPPPLPPGADQLDSSGDSRPSGDGGPGVLSRKSN